MVIRRVDPLSFAKVAGVIYLILGFAFGACITLFAIGGFFSGEGNNQMPFYFGSGAIVALPIFYGVLGFLGALIMSVLFNFVVGITGGVEVDAS